jgi:hypothetical protein
MDSCASIFHFFTSVVHGLLLLNYPKVLIGILGEDKYGFLLSWIVFLLGKITALELITCCCCVSLCE